MRKLIITGIIGLTISGGFIMANNKTKQVPLEQPLPAPSTIEYELVEKVEPVEEIKEFHKTIEIVDRPAQLEETPKPSNPAPKSTEPTKQLESPEPEAKEKPVDIFMTPNRPRAELQQCNPEDISETYSCGEVELRRWQK